MADNKKLFAQELDDVLINNSDKRSTIPLDDSSTSQLVEIIPHLAEARNTIESTRDSLLKAAENDPSLHLLLYTTNDESRAFLPWWSQVLHRIDIAQHLLRIKASGTLNVEGYELYPNERNAVDSVVRAISGKSKNAILTELTKDPESYERVLLWMSEGEERMGEGVYEKKEKDYIMKCAEGFAICFGRINGYRAGDDFMNIVWSDNAFGMIEKRGNETIKMPADVEGKKLSDRQSMNWFAKEVGNVYMFRFQWENAIGWAKFVYKILTHT